MYEKLSDPPKLFNISTAKEFICPKLNKIQLQSSYGNMDNNNSTYGIENYVDMNDSNWRVAIGDVMNKS